MPRQLSTSLSDLILAVSAFYVAHHWHERQLFKAAIGIGIQGIAASFGVFRFAMADPEGTIIYKIHKLTSWLAGAVGVPLIGLMFCAKYSSSSLSNKISLFVVCVVVVAIFLPPKTRELCSQAVSGFSILIMCILCSTNSNWYGLGACVVYIIAGAVFGSDGTVLGIPKVDYLHYLLVAGNTLFKLSL